MQNDASKEGNDATPPSSVRPQRSRPSFGLVGQMDGGRNNACNEVRYVPNDALVVGPRKRTTLSQAYGTNFMQPTAKA
jgi:hypothetical protein